MTRIRFISHNDDRELGTAELVDGRLVADGPIVQSIIDGKVLALDMSGPQASEYFASWSNGYIGSEGVSGADGANVAESLMRRPTTTVGIDLAATSLGTAIVALDWEDAAATARLVSDAASGIDDTDLILTTLARDDRIGIDCPFGWPVDFIDAITTHRDGGRWPTGPNVDDRRSLRLRATDRHVADTYGVQPLSVSSDKMGSVAMRWASLLARHEFTYGPTDRTGGGRVIEVYPALAFRIWTLAAEAPQVADYKKKDEEGAAARELLLEVIERRVRQLRIGDDVRRAAAHHKHGDDVVDALLAALVAAAAATPGGVEDAPDRRTAPGRHARTEGWIAVPDETSLASLAPSRGPWFKQ